MGGLFNNYGERGYMKTSLRKRIAKEWLILLVSILVGFPLLVLVFTFIATFSNPANKWKEMYSTAWWNRISQKDIEVFKTPEWEHVPATLDQNHEKAIQAFENNYEKSSRFEELSFFDKYQIRRKYIEGLYSEGLHYIAEKELAELAFHKINMEADIAYLRKANKWVEPVEGENLNGSRLRFKWKELWKILGEGLSESRGILALIILIPYILSILVRSVVWAIKNH
jgi:hypothetical protein